MVIKRWTLPAGSCALPDHMSRQNTFRLKTAQEGSAGQPWSPSRDASESAWHGFWSYGSAAGRDALGRDESGPHFRPLNLDWARNIRDQCLKAGVPFFFKQVGGRTPKAAGRTLDGRTWDEFPPMTSEWLWWDSIQEVVYERMSIQ